MPPTSIQCGRRVQCCPGYGDQGRLFIYSIRRRLLDFFAVTARVEFAHESCRAIFCEFEFVPVHLRKWLCCHHWPNVQSLSAPGRFCTGRWLDAKNVKMRAVNLLFTE